jgi:hypothetical protein
MQMNPYQFSQQAQTVSASAQLSPVGPSEEAPISRELQRLVNSIGEVEQLLTALEQRLQPVLTPQPPSAGGADGKPANVSRAPMAEAVAASGDRAVMLSLRLQYLLRSLGI